MTQQRVAESDIYIDVKDEQARETFKQLNENIRNLQAQVDSLKNQLEVFEGSSALRTVLVESSSLSVGLTQSEVIALTMALG